METMVRIYKRIKAIIDSIAEEPLTCKQISKKTGIPYHAIITYYIHPLVDVGIIEDVGLMGFGKAHAYLSLYERHSPQGQAPPLQQKGEIVEAETCPQCGKQLIPRQGYPNAENDLECPEGHYKRRGSKQSHLQGEVGGLEKGD